MLNLQSKLILYIEEEMAAANRFGEDEMQELLSELSFDVDVAEKDDNVEDDENDTDDDGDDHAIINISSSNSNNNNGNTNNTSTVGTCTTNSSTVGTSCNTNNANTVGTTNNYYGAVTNINRANKRVVKPNSLIGVPRPGKYSRTK